MKVAIIDYGSGNLRSAAKAFERVASSEFRVPSEDSSRNSQLATRNFVQITSNPSDLADATHIVLPGVGAFADCMNGLKALSGMIDALENEVLVKKKPFLGICVGMQLLADEGHEFGVYKGLGWISGVVRKLDARCQMPDASKFPVPGSRFPVNTNKKTGHWPLATGHLKIPHMGWNNVNVQKKDSELFIEIDNDSDFYFVHSYVLEVKDKSNVLATCNYGEKFTAVVGRENIFGTQFHPEKSQKNGLKLIENFLKVK